MVCHASGTRQRHSSSSARARGRSARGIAIALLDGHLEPARSALLASPPHLDAVKLGKWVSCPDRAKGVLAVSLMRRWKPIAGLLVALGMSSAAVAHAAD